MNMVIFFKNTYFEEHLWTTASINRSTVSLNFEPMASNLTSFFQEKSYF